MREPSGPLAAFSAEEQFTIEKHIQAFVAGSDRVRHILLLSIVASILTLAAYRSSFSEGWFSRRVGLAHLAAQHKVWDEQRVSRVFAKCILKTNLFRPVPTPQLLEEQAASADFLRARHWYWLSGHTRETFRYFADHLEESRVNEVQFVRMPFLGTQFDINDLGFFSAVGLAIIAILLSYSMARHYENLIFCLWMTRRLAEREMRLSDSLSRANFFYHILAMGQVFSRPPTLARWKGLGLPLSRLVSIALFLVPVGVQALVLRQDLKTREVGMLFSPWNTTFTMTVHIIFFGVLVLFTCMTLGYAFASDTRWRAAFFDINPAFKLLRKPPIGYWIFPDASSRFRFRRLKEGLCLVDVDRGLVWRDLPGEPGHLWGIQALSAHDKSRNLSPRIFDLFRLRDLGVYLVSRSDKKISIERLRHPRPLTTADGGQEHYAWIGELVKHEDPDDADTLYEIEGDILMMRRVGFSEAMPIAKLRAKGVLSARRRFEELAVVGDRIVVVDRDRRGLWLAPAAPPSSGPVVHANFSELSYSWRPVAVAPSNGKVVVALVPRRIWRWIFKPLGGLVRLRYFSVAELVALSGRPNGRAEDSSAKKDAA
ncbi:MAG: hypothetical protein SF066_11000 [Thermoanaerobaculia bacterium]|nr:hypothetical protein [Thermoanaerobaculia bacterium]